MGGHSHWAGIKHKKALTDAKKGKVFTKIIREITIAAKLGGADLEGNPRLRKAMEDAKNANMPNDNVKRAIQKGTGQLPGETFEEVTYEGYGPCKTAVIVEGTTDNKNRTFSEIRKVFDNAGGSIGTTGCVAYMFKHKGQVLVGKSAAKEDALIDIALSAGAEDVQATDAGFSVLCAPADVEKIKDAVVKSGIAVESAEATMLPDMYIKIENPADAEKVVNFMDTLDGLDDVKNVYSNFDIPEEILAKIEK